mgnify:FL=1
MTGIYLEPGKAYVTNEVAFMETNEEFEEMRTFINAHDYHVFYE